MKRVRKPCLPGDAVRQPRCWGALRRGHRASLRPAFLVEPTPLSSLLLAAHQRA